MKKNLIVITILFFFSSCVIQNPKPEECHVVETTIIDVYEGPSYDIFFGMMTRTTIYQSWIGTGTKFSRYLGKGFK